MIRRTPLLLATKTVIRNTVIRNPTLSTIHHDEEAGSLLFMNMSLLFVIFSFLTSFPPFFLFFLVVFFVLFFCLVGVFQNYPTLSC